MAWVAITAESPVQGDTVVTTVRFTNGTKTVDVQLPNDGTVAGLSAAARAFVAQRNNQGDRTTIVPPGTLLDLVGPTPAQPTQAELDRSAWLKDWATYQGYLRGINANLPGMTSTTPVIANLKASLDAGFKPAYAGSL